MTTAVRACGLALACTATLSGHWLVDRQPTGRPEDLRHGAAPRHAAGDAAAPRRPAPAFMAAQMMEARGAFWGWAGADAAGDAGQPQEPGPATGPQASAGPAANATPLLFQAKKSPEAAAAAPTGGGLWAGKPNRDPPLPVINPPVYGKKRLVVLGSGWAASSFIKSLDPSVVGENGQYQLIQLSPRNYFLYSPLLPGAATGAVECRSIIEPVRNIIGDKGAYYEAAAIKIDPQRRVLLSQSVFDGRTFEVGYDVLVFAVGSVSNDFGIAGVSEHCFFLKSVDDARKFRRQIQKVFEQAALPTTTEEERRRLLTFLVAGGGPTGVETAAEIHDLVTEDLVRIFPQLKSHVQICLVDSNSHVLSMYDSIISQYTTTKFKREGIRLILQARVTAVSEGVVHLKYKTTGKEERIAAGTILWCTGIGQNKLTTGLIASLPKGTQSNTRALTTDDGLRVLGSGGTIYALGDAATIEQNCARAHARELFAEFDANGSGGLARDITRMMRHDTRFNARYNAQDRSELGVLLERASKRFPHFREHARLFRKDLKEMSESHSPLEELAQTTAGYLTSSISGSSEIEQAFQDAKGGELTLAEFTALLDRLDQRLRSLPATAQVAKQQGNFLARLANKGKLGPKVVPKGRAFKQLESDEDEADATFVWTNMGSMAYIGRDDAVMNVPFLGSVKGWLVGFLWKGFESFNQMCFRNTVLVTLDYFKAKMFGRDVSRT